MSSKYGIIPYAQHHACIVAGLGIAGCFDEAMSVIRGSMPSSGCHAPMWLALLDACRKWGNVKVGRFAFEAVVELDRNLAAAYVLMCDIYVSAGMVEDADKIKAMQVKYAG
jgi:pentatricopeptide repeat protein